MLFLQSKIVFSEFLLIPPSVHVVGVVENDAPSFA